MEVVNRLCLHDQFVEDGEKHMKLNRGQEYTTSREKDGQVFVFSSYWFWAPSEWFGGAEALPRQSMRDE